MTVNTIALVGPFFVIAGCDASQIVRTLNFMRVYNYLRREEPFFEDVDLNWVLCCAIAMRTFFFGLLNFFYAILLSINLWSNHVMTQCIFLFINSTIKFKNISKKFKNNVLVLFLRSDFLQKQNYSLHHNSRKKKENEL